MTKDAALRLALEALEWSKPHADAELTYQEAITAIKAALLSRSDGEAKDELVCVCGAVWEGQELVIAPQEEVKDEIDWKDMYEKQKRRSEMWVAKYEKDIGPLETAGPQQEVKDEPWEKFCDSNCVWTDHHPDCKLAKDEPVAWVGLNLDNMAEAFHRVIEEHHSRKNPFHDPVNGDAMIALRELRGLIAYMKRNTTPPQRKPLTDEEIWKALGGIDCTRPMLIARAIEAAHGIKGEA